MDGTHCPCWEPQHPTLPFDSKFYSNKHKGAGLTYEIGLAIHENRVFWVAGPYPAGHNDKLMFVKSGLQARTVSLGKRLIADSGYAGMDGICLPMSKYDSPAVNMYKRRARARHETFNARLKNFGILKQQFRYRIDRMEKHKMVFEAICVIAQIQMDNGSPLLEV